MKITTQKNETAKEACTKARRQIGRLLVDLAKECDATGNDWGDAGSLGHVRELLGEAVGFLKGVEGDEIIKTHDAVINGRRQKVTIPND